MLFWVQLELALRFLQAVAVMLNGSFLSYPDFVHLVVLFYSLDHQGNRPRRRVGDDGVRHNPVDQHQDLGPAVTRLCSTVLTAARNCRNKCCAYLRTSLPMLLGTVVDAHRTRSPAREGDTGWQAQGLGAGLQAVPSAIIAYSPTRTTAAMHDGTDQHERLQKLLVQTEGEFEHYRDCMEEVKHKLELATDQNAPMRLDRVSPTAAIALTVSSRILSFRSLASSRLCSFFSWRSRQCSSSRSFGSGASVTGRAGLVCQSLRQSSSSASWRR